GDHNTDFHPMVDFLKASPLRIKTTEEGTKILATIDGIVRTVSESSLRRNLKLRDEEGISSLPDVELFENLTLMGYNIFPNQKRTRIAQSSVPPTVVDQDRATIDKSSTLPHDSAPRVTSPTAVKGSMQQTILELTDLCTSLERKLFELSDKFQSQEVEITRLKESVKQLEEREGVAATNSGDDAPIKERSMDEGEAATERVSDDTEEMATVLTSMDAATVLASGVVDVPTGSGSIPTASTPAKGSVPTGSEEVPTASPEQIDAQVARELEEQLEREDQRRAEQIARDAEITRIHAEEELQSMINGLDSNNETIAKYLEEYRQFSSELPMERRIELISNLSAKVKDFRGMTFKEVKAKFNSICKQMEDFIPMVSKEEDERIKRKVEWKLYDSCGVHHVAAKDKEIFMLVEKDYPLRKGLALVMICYKLQVENFSQMANELVLKIYRIANSSR
nr:hypothetical protein [Tanacetum cinerariifolium]